MRSHLLNDTTAEQYRHSVAQGVERVAAKLATTERPFTGVTVDALAPRIEDIDAFTAGVGIEYESFVRQELGEETVERFHGILRDQDLDPADYLLIPVHPWQWWNKLTKKDPLMALVAAAVQARLPHPARPAVTDAPPQVRQSQQQPATPAPASAEEGHDALLRRLRELGDLHCSGVLTEEEFTLAKQAVLKRM
ncbi:IucA/IucC family protein [Streptomyces sp. TRM68367]|uniref:SHOCT domain-containing protein n=1 Tax=Streptomyces sp. TRM68367 TaxID=2758415 RepID=UPI0037DDC64E